jgi:1,4-dihydroxy-2-naphthoate polyprenyltransferase
MTKSFITILLASRPQFLTASVSPVLVGSALGFAVAGTFNWPLFLLALFGMMALHAGANITNDYFDSLSGNDWANKNVTPFSGGRQFIQQNILSPKTTLFTGLFFLALGALLGLVIVYLTHSLFILILGIVGLAGGFLYTAPPVKFGYRGVGEIFIGILFGLLPVYGAYYLQTGRIDIFPLPAGYIIGVLVYLIILANEFPDLDADSSVNKKTLVVRFGIPVSIWLYRIPLISTFIAAGFAVLISQWMLWPCVLYFLFGLPVAVAAINFINDKALSTPGPTQHRACAVTIILHLIGTLALTAGFIIAKFILRQMS